MTRRHFVLLVILLLACGGWREGSVADGTAIRRGLCRKRGRRKEAVRQLWLLSVPWPRSTRIECDRAAPRAAPIAFTAFSRYVRRPTGQMPPYTTRVVSDADMAHIYAFVQARPAPAAVQSIPLLREP